MKFPNKVTSYQESVFPKFAIVLNTVFEEPTNVFQLYDQTKKQFDDTQDFIEVLVLLYGIKKINLDSEGRIFYVN